MRRVTGKKQRGDASFHDEERGTGKSMGNAQKRLRWKRYSSTKSQSPTLLDATNDPTALMPSPLESHHLSAPHPRASLWKSNQLRVDFVSLASRERENGLAGHPILAWQTRQFHAAAGPSQSTCSASSPSLSTSYFLLVLFVLFETVLIGRGASSTPLALRTAWMPTPSFRLSSYPRPHFFHFSLTVSPLSSFLFTV